MHFIEDTCHRVSIYNRQYLYDTAILFFFLFLFFSCATFYSANFCRYSSASLLFVLEERVRLIAQWLHRARHSKSNCQMVRFNTFMYINFCLQFSHLNWSANFDFVRRQINWSQWSKNSNISYIYISPMESKSGWCHSIAFFYTYFVADIKYCVFFFLLSSRSSSFHQRLFE